MKLSQALRTREQIKQTKASALEMALNAWTYALNTWARPDRPECAGENPMGSDALYRHFMAAYEDKQEVKRIILMLKAMLATVRAARQQQRPEAANIAANSGEKSHQENVAGG